ncbi:MAG TPA: molybdenum cofactor guanylyltransferase [Gemmatimonadales bacterium]
MRGAVLAGGKASRFDGRPKGLERVGGERILDRVVALVRVATGSMPLLIANAGDASSWHPDLQVKPDEYPDCGSLGGIYSAVVAGDGPVLLVAWDMPFLSADLLVALVNGAGDHDVFLPQSEGPRGVEPLCGVYGPACREPILDRLRDEDYRAIGFHDAVNVGTLPLERVASFGDPATLFFNVNTAEDLQKAEELWRQYA